MGEEEKVADVLFLGLVAQIQMQAWVHLGKVMHPATHKAEVDLDAAREAIDLLGMIEAKTKGNLTAEENRFVQQTLTTLRLNFVDEAKRQEQSKRDEKPAAGESPSEGPSEPNTEAAAPPSETAGGPEHAGEDARS